MPEQSLRPARSDDPAKGRALGPGGSVPQESGPPETARAPRAAAPRSEEG